MTDFAENTRLKKKCQAVDVKEKVYVYISAAF